MDLWKYLKQSNKPIVLYGMGNGADRILDVLEQIGVKAQGVFASDGFVRHQSFRGFMVCSYEEIKAQFREMVVLLSFGTHRMDVMENVRRIMQEQEVYAPDVPVAGKTLFDEDFVLQNRGKFEQVYIMLADDQSKKVYENVIRAKLTGKIQYLFECQSEPKEAYETLGLSLNEQYLDIGAYTGDTALRFAQWTNNQYGCIDAVEPDRKNFEKLVKNTDGLFNVNCHHCCLDQKVGKCFFAMDGGRKSRSINSGGGIVAAETVDHLFSDRTFTWVKMDVEGMENAVLQGASNLINRCRPKMDVAAYHRSEDLFSIPLLIQKICPNAKVYLRHFPSLPAWDTNFYFKW